MTRRRRPEDVILDAIRLALGEWGDCVFWRLVPMTPPDASGRVIRSGPTGMADLVGIVSGRFTAIEVKTRTGHLSEDQITWGKLVNSMGGYYGVARSVEEAKDIVDRASSGCPAPEPTKKS